eukprot:TRINITY_DN3408_c0_g1_i5.p1 TRINITY_DN3408_c0_g1~~TRINITY_DN3408_c0_g1_i5.p1  ORF type:complete len:177 (-),score=7.91 TRINITY_DN3408_c0_g1_i5:159-689(-)
MCIRDSSMCIQSIFVTKQEVAELLPKKSERMRCENFQVHDYWIRRRLLISTTGITMMYAAVANICWALYGRRRLYADVPMDTSSDLLKIIRTISLVDILIASPLAINLVIFTVKKSIFAILTFCLVGLWQRINRRDPERRFRRIVKSTASSCDYVEMSCVEISYNQICRNKQREQQ